MTFSVERNPNPRTDDERAAFASGRNVAIEPSGCR